MCPGSAGHGFKILHGSSLLSGQEVVSGSKIFLFLHEMYVVGMVKAPKNFYTNVSDKMAYTNCAGPDQIILLLEE